MYSLIIETLLKHSCWRP